MDAEDMVQETYLRYQGTKPSTIHSLKAYLTTIITRLCVDQLQLARRKRELYVGPWLPEPILTATTGEVADPQERVDKEESISLAFLLLLEQLQPFERAVFLLHLPHLQLDELRTRLRNAKQVLWLWLAIDPCTKLVPVLHLGPRTQYAAHLFIHSLRQHLAHACLPRFTSDGLNLSFYAALRSFWTLARGGASWVQSPAMAGSSGSDLRPGEKMLTCGASWCESRT